MDRMPVDLVPGQSNITKSEKNGGDSEPALNLHDRVEAENATKDHQSCC